jgi:hypothetical protein
MQLADMRAIVWSEHPCKYSRPAKLVSQVDRSGHNMEVNMREALSLAELRDVGRAQL